MVKEVVICDNCKSTDVSIQKVDTDVHYGTILDCDSLQTRAARKSWYTIAKCTCNACGHKFEEDMGYHTRTLCPEEIWK